MNSDVNESDTHTDFFLVNNQLEFTLHTNCCYL